MARFKRTTFGTYIEDTTGYKLLTEKTNQMSTIGDDVFILQRTQKRSESARKQWHRYEIIFYLRRELNYEDEETEIETLENKITKLINNNANSIGIEQYEYVSTVITRDPNTKVSVIIQWDFLIYIN